MTSPGEARRVYAEVDLSGPRAEVEARRAVSALATLPSRVEALAEVRGVAQATRALPPFAEAVAHADPFGLVASAEDLPDTRGHKRITFNATDRVTILPPDCAWWLWPFEEVTGARPSRVDDTLDLRRWEGRPWIETIERHPNRIQDGSWWIAVGIVHGDMVDADTCGMFGGLGYGVTLYFPHFSLNSGNGQWQHMGTSGGGEPGLSIGELEWGVRGTWIYSVHVNALHPDGAPHTSFEMAGAPTGNWQYPRPSPSPLHLGLLVGNYAGSGVAESMIVRPAHSLRLKRY